MTGTRLRVGTRGSQLALRQTGLVLDAIRRVAPGISLETTIVTTAGDRAVDVPLERLDGVGFFAKELEAALVDGRCDLAVHSAKDLPTSLRSRAHARRGAAADGAAGCPDLAGQGAARRPAAGRPGGDEQPAARGAAAERTARISGRSPIRGNLDTRLAKLDRGECEALCVAGAGLVRMGWQDRITEWLAPAVMLPAPAQGALAVESAAPTSSSLSCCGRWMTRRRARRWRRSGLSSRGSRAAAAHPRPRSPTWGRAGSCSRGCWPPKTAGSCTGTAPPRRWAPPAGSASASRTRVLDGAGLPAAAAPPSVGREPAARGVCTGVTIEVERALAGRRILVTRPRGDDRLRRLLEREGAHVVEFPTIRIAPASRPRAARRGASTPPGYGWVVFTSRNGVAAVINRLAALGRTPSALAGAGLAVIGPGTAEALGAHGLRAEVAPVEFGPKRSSPRWPLDLEHAHPPAAGLDRAGGAARRPTPPGAIVDGCHRVSETVSRAATRRGRSPRFGAARSTR